MRAEAAAASTALKTQLREHWLKLQAQLSDAASNAAQQQAIMEEQQAIIDAMARAEAETGQRMAALAAAYEGVQEEERGKAEVALAEQAS